MVRERSLVSLAGSRALVCRLRAAVQELDAAVASVCTSMNALRKLGLVVRADGHFACLLAALRHIADDMHRQDGCSDRHGMLRAASRAQAAW